MMARPKKDHATEPRTQQMAAMYRQGITCEKIGQQYGITRERVRQLLKKVGLSRIDGGIHRSASAKLARKTGAMELRVRQKWGIDLATWRTHRKDGSLQRFAHQRCSAGSRGIGFHLTFPEWYSIWESSGRLGLHGRGKSFYCMSRIRDDGAYEMGNVHIQSCVENSREAVAKWRGKTKANRGVYFLYPGLATPWLSKLGKKSLGLYATETEALAAREAYRATIHGESPSESTARA
jgi:hypothetical protein